MLFVQFWINSTRDVWKFCQPALAPAASPILVKFPNITRTVNPKLYTESHDYLYTCYNKSISGCVVLWLMTAC